MDNTNNNTPIFSRMTVSRIASSKGLLLFCALISLFLDVAVVVMLFFNTSDIKFLVCPALLFGIDVLLLIKAIFSNYRFSYAIKGVWVHVVSVLVVCAYMIVSSEILDGRIIFTTFALYAMPGVHLVQSLAALTSALHAVNKSKISRSVIAVMTTAVFTAAAVFYGYFISQNGFFGQGNNRTERTLVYSYDEAKGCYVVTDLLRGFGNTVIIPESFDGVPVGGIDCAVFSDKMLSYIVFDCSSEIEFLNAEKLGNVNSDLQYETGKTNFDDLRKHLFALTEKNSQFFSVANGLSPYDLEENQVYVTFCYTPETLALAGNTVLPTWFGSVNDVLDLTAYANDVHYIEHSDPYNRTDLYWCTQNQNSMIFKTVTDDNGTDVNKTAIKQSVKVNLSFEKIYQISFGEDNDTVFTVDPTYTGFTIDGEYKPYRLATAGRVEEILDQIPKRNGFSLSFKVGSNKHDLADDIQEELAILDETGAKELNIYPHWQIQSPVINAIAADGKTQNHSAIYGKDVALTSIASAPHSDILLRYEWRKDGVVSTSANHTISNIHPQDAGEYTLTVTAYAEDSSLTATATKSVVVGFEKRELHFNWSLPDNMVYSATNKDVVYTPVDAINGDSIIPEKTIAFTLNGSTQSVGVVRNVGSYTVSIALTGDAATKYKIAELNNSRSFDITPYAISVQWGSDVFEYDGTKKIPQATVIGLGNDGSLPLTLSGEQINVGSDYIATASLSNPNYTLTDIEKAYTINPKPITSVIWESTSSFVYTSVAQYPKVTGFAGVIDSDKNAVLKDLIYAGMQVNVGNGYTATVQLGSSLASNNYILDCVAETTFSITPKSMVLTVGNLNTSYTGTIIDPSKFSFSTKDVAKNDKIEEIVSLAYKTYLEGTETDAIHVVSGGYTITGDHIPAAKYENYEITIVPGTLQINPITLVIKLHDQEKTYDGTPFTHSAYTYEYSGLMEAYDTFSEVIRVLSFAEILDTNADIYQISAQVNSGNEGIKYNNYKIEIRSANLTIHKAPLTVHAVGTTKTYDGYELTNDAFSIWVEGNLYAGATPTDLGTVVYGGNAVAAKSAGTYTLTVALTANDVNRNYAITYETDSVIINPKPITITAMDTSKIYNGQIGGTFDFEIGLDQLAFGDDKASLGTITYGGEATMAKDAGEYVITVTSLGSSNYTIAQAINGTFTINKKGITITPVATNKNYDGEIGGQFSITASGLISGETIGILGNPIFYGTASTAKNAGQYILEVVLETEPKNYVVEEYYTGDFVISKSKVTVTIATLSKIYDGKVVDTNAIEYSVTGLFGNDTLQLLGIPQYSGTLVENHLGTVGSYSLTLTLPGNENYESNTTTFNYTIKQKEITVSAVATDRIYDGTAGGTFFVTAEGMIDGEDVSVLGNPIFYGSAKTATNAGEYTLYVQFSGSTGNYKVVELKSDSFTIAQKDVTVTAVATDKIYNGKVGGTFAIIADGLIYGETVSALGTPEFYGDATTAVNVGQYTLEVRFNGSTGNYNVTALYTSAFTITPKDVTVTAVATGKVYNGKVGGTFSVVADGLVAGETVSVLGTPEFYGNATSAINAGEYTLQVRYNDSTGNYNVVECQNATFTIAQKDITVTAVAEDKVYDGAMGGLFSIVVDGLIDGESMDVLGTPDFYGDATTALNAGKYVLQVRFNDSTGNYRATVLNSTVFTIAQKEITVTANAVDRVYNGTAGGTFYITAEGLLQGDDVSVLGTPYFYGNATTAVSAGEYTLQVRFNASTGNYKATVLNSGVFTINKKDVTVTAVATDKTYNGKAGGTFSVVADGLISGETVSVLGTPEFYGEAVTAINVGSYALQVRYEGSTGNYNVIETNGTIYTINKKDIIVTANAVDRVYNGMPGGAFSITASGLISGETVSVLGTPEFYGDAVTAVNAGQYTLQVRFNEPTGNYNVVSFNNGVFKINKKDITVTAVAADKIYDGQIGGDFSYIVEGLIDNETPADIGCTFEFIGTAVTAINAGEYTLQIRVNGSTGNYNVTKLNSDTFKIIKKDITVTAVATNKIYDGQTGGSFSFTVDGLVNNENAGVLGSYQFIGSAVTAVNAGEYELQVRFTSTGNYNVATMNSAVFTIAKKDVTVTAVAVDKIYDGQIGGEFSFTVEGLVNGETINALGSYEFIGSAVTAVNAGEYELQVRFTSAGNYNVVTVNGTVFTISAREVTVTAVAVDRAYSEDEVGGEFSFIAEGFIGESENDFVAVFGGEAVNATEKGTYVLTVVLTCENPTDNYVFNYVDTLFTIS